MLGDHACIPSRGVLQGPALVGEVDADESEPLLVAPRPLEVVQQRPHVVAADVDTLAERLEDRPQVRLQVVDPVPVVDGPVLDDVMGSQTVLGDVDGQPDVALHPEQ